MVNFDDIVLELEKIDSVNCLNSNNYIVLPFISDIHFIGVDKDRSISILVKTKLSSQVVFPFKNNFFTFLPHIKCSIVNFISQDELHDNFSILTLNNRNNNKVIVTYFLEII